MGGGKRQHIGRTNGLEPICSPAGGVQPDCPHTRARPDPDGQTFRPNRYPVGPPCRGRFNRESKRLNDRAVEITKVVMAIADELGVSASHVALKWTMQQGFSSIPIVG